MWGQDYNKYRPQISKISNSSFINKMQISEIKQQNEFPPKIIQTDQIYQFAKQDEQYFQYLEDRFLNHKLVKNISSSIDWRNKDKRDFRYKISNLVNELGMEIQKNVNNSSYPTRIIVGVQNLQQISMLTLHLQKALKQISEKMQNKNQNLSKSRIMYYQPGGQPEYNSFVNSVGEYVKKVNQLTKPSLNQECRLNKSYSSKLLIPPSINQKDISSLQRQVSSLKSALNESQKENKRLQNQIKKLSQETTKLRNESDLFNQKLKKLSSQYLSIQQQCSSKQNELIALNNAMKQHQLSNLDRVKALKQTIKQQERQLHQMDKIQKQNIEMSCAIKQYRDECSKLQVQMNQLIKDRQQKCYQIQKMRVVINKNQQDIKQFKDILKNSNKQSNQIKQVLVEKLNVIKSLQSNLVEANSHRKRLEQQIKTIQAQNSQSINILAQKTKEIQSLSALLSETKYQIRSKSQQVEFFEGELTKRNNHVKELENILNSKEVQNQELRDQLRRLQTTLEQLMKQQRAGNYKPFAKESKHDPMRSSMIFLKKNYDSTQPVDAKMKQSTVMGGENGLLRLKIFQLQNKMKELQLNHKNKSEEFDMQRELFENQNKRLKEELSNQREAMERKTKDMKSAIQKAIQDFMNNKE